MKVYLIITADKYELPVFIADNASDIAKFIGASIATVHCMISRQNKVQKKFRIIKCNIENDDMEGKNDDL